MRLGARMQQEGVSDSAAGAWTLADITKVRRAASSFDVLATGPSHRAVSCCS